MAWLLFILAILSIVFPPLAFILLALMVMGVFAKGMDAAVESEEDDPRKRARYRPNSQRYRATIPPQATETEQGPVIDVRSYPIPSPEPLPAPVAKQFPDWPS